MLSRRGMLGGLLALAAPAIIRTPGLLMPIRPLALARDVEAWKYNRANFLTVKTEFSVDAHLTASSAWFVYPTPANIAMVRRAIEPWRGNYPEIPA